MYLSDKGLTRVYVRSGAIMASYVNGVSVNMVISVWSEKILDSITYRCNATRCDVAIISRSLTIEELTVTSWKCFFASDELYWSKNAPGVSYE